MKKAILVVSVVLISLMVMSCAGKKKCPAYSKVSKTETSDRS